SEFTVPQVKWREPSLKRRSPQYCNYLARDAAVEAMRAGAEGARAGVRHAVERAGGLALVIDDDIIARYGDGERAVVADERAGGAEASHVHELLAQEAARARAEERPIGLRDVAARGDDRL